MGYKVSNYGRMHDLSGDKVKPLSKYLVISFPVGRSGEDKIAIRPLLCNKHIFPWNACFHLCLRFVYIDQGMHFKIKQQKVKYQVALLVFSVGISFSGF